jgi:hypothetical protein
MDRLRQETPTLPLFDEERQLLLAALDLFLQEQARTYMVCIPIRIPATHRTLPSEKRFVTGFLRRWNEHWQSSQDPEATWELELVREERDEGGEGVFFELTFCMGRKLWAQEKAWLEDQPGVVTVLSVRDAEEDFPQAPLPVGGRPV